MVDDFQVIDDDGDVVFIVGATKKKLRVSSATLSKVSPVFKALLGPHFREGQSERSSTQPVEVNLPDDDPTAMTRVLELVHLKEVHCLITGAGATFSRRILDVVIVVDKYDLVKPLRLQCYAMLAHFINYSSLENSTNSQGNIIAASYILDQRNAFAEMTRRFLRAMHPAASVLLKELSGQRLPLAVLLALQERRSSSAPNGLCLRCVQEDGFIYTVCNKHI